MKDAGSTSPPALPDVDWALLLKLTRLYAMDQINRRPWRSRFGGLLPDGYDADSIASLVVARVSQELTHPPASTHRPPLSPIQSCQRHTYNTVHSLSRRTENFILINEPDLDRISVEGELQSPTELVIDPGPSPDTALLLKEQAAQFHSFRQNFRASLGHDQLLKNIFDCFCADIKKPKAIAAMLGIDPAGAHTALKRLHRRLDPFLQQNPPPSTW